MVPALNLSAAMQLVSSHKINYIISKKHFSQSANDKKALFYELKRLYRIFKTVWGSL